jgi:ABC-type antimicrobial peptide transport system permease subunit
MNWLISIQGPGGLDHLSENQPGGWSYNAHNLIYSDGDDTSMALMALAKLTGQSAHLEYRRRVAVKRATDWLFYMQGDDGGWATFLRDDDKDNDEKLPTGIDDWSIADVTGHVLSAFGAVGIRASDERIKQAIEFLERSQTKVGSWYGRWGLSYIYGTAAALVGLYDVEADMNVPFVQKAAAWIETQQNADGGWGEEFSAWDQSRGISYTEISKRSTHEQTAWAIMGLLAAGRPADFPSVIRGIDYLLTPRKPKPTFPDGDYTVLGIDPYTNSLYSTYWPLMALGLYLKATKAGGGAAEDPCASYARAHEGLPTAEFTADVFGGSADLSYSLTAEDSEYARLWLENKGEYQIKALSLSLAPEGAPNGSAQTWEADSLKPGSRLSWRASITNASAQIWILQFTYSDPAGRPVEIIRQLKLERAVGAGFDLALLPWILSVPLIVAIAWALRRIFGKYRPLLALGFNNLRKHRVRTGLTSLGIIFGTAAIGATLTLSLAFRTQLIKDFATFGTNRIIVFPYNVEFKFGPPASALRRQPNTRFDKGDVATVKSLPQVLGASPFVQEDIVVAHSGQSLQMNVMFVDPETYLDVAASSVQSGRFLHEDSKREVVIGYAVAQDGYEVPVQLGDKLTVDGSEFDVVGIMSEVGGIRGRAGPIVSPDIVIYAPLAEATGFTGRNSYDGLEVRAESALSTENVAKQIEDITKRKHISSEFSVITSSRLLDQVRDLLWQFTAIVVLIGLLTLIVSGIGVANMMLISIRERVEEIGIIKALGGRDRTVMMIFLSEAASIGVFSAIFGSLLGLSLLMVFQWIVGVSVLPVAPYLLLFSVVFSLLITLGSGTYPAYAAARLDPAEAIRRA